VALRNPENNAEAGQVAKKSSTRGASSKESAALGGREMNAARRRRTSNDGLLTWAHVDMVQRKLRALSDGTHTDCVFIVGYDDKSAQVE
jgi:hypothetical protein